MFNLPLLSFADTKSMQNMMTKLPDGIFQCLLCETTRVRVDSMREHLRDLHVDARYRFLCPICKKTYKNRNTFRVHIFQAHKAENKDKSINIDSCKVLGTDFHW